MSERMSHPVSAAPAQGVTAPTRIGPAPPGPHSMVFRGPRPRSMEIAMWPDNTMIIFS